MKEKSFEVSGKDMIKLLQENNAQLHRWEMGFFCLNPQPADHAFGESPQEPWIGSVMFQQMVGSGAISNDGLLIEQKVDKPRRARP
jgi:hypothetical protein